MSVQHVIPMNKSSKPKSQSRLRDPNAKYLTFYMTPKEHRAFKMAVAGADTSMQEVLEQLVRDWIASQKKRR